jgi:protein-tyrosine phosphatase
MMQGSLIKPIPEFYVVQPGQLLAGNYPNASDDKGVRAKLRHLLEGGVTLFVDLTEEGELEPYTPLLEEEANALGITVEHRRMPIPDFDVPTVTEMEEILDTIDAALAAGHIVYVHCHFGLGRTGTVAGCYLVRHSIDGEQALAELARLRQGTRFQGMSSPVTHQQRQMVRDWSIGG